MALSPRRVSLLAALMFPALALSVPAQANLVSNGNFSSACASFCTYYAGDARVFDWTINSGSIDVDNTPSQAPPGGGYSVDLAGFSPGSISTTFTSVVGQAYRVTFMVSGNPDGGGSLKLGTVSAGGQSQGFSYDTALNNTTRQSMNYLSQSFDFFANDTLTTLTFTGGDNDPKWGIMIGNVDVTATPEPMTLALMGAGLAGFGVLRRRRK